ncbi:hypothetical protein AB1Y20_019440 [Prymnesium parvum]|uniref:Uncharacterized protein n=1 Tax=Prymnesium parvum TaxID=97485 RepID=A0AB34JU42_PRYPA
MSEQVLHESLSILKNLAKKYETDGAHAHARARSASPLPPSGHGRTSRPASPGRGHSEKRPPWRPVRTLPSVALDPQHLTPSRTQDRAVSPGRRPSVQLSTEDKAAARRAANSSAIGEGLWAAELRTEATFTIRVRDEEGRPVRSGGDRVRCFFRGRSAPELQLVDLGDGSYEGRYAANVSGNYELHIMLDGKAINGSPFHVTVRAGTACVSKCVALGEGLTHAVAGKSSDLTIKAYDAAGTAKIVGADAFKLHIFGPVRGPEDHSASRHATLRSEPVVSKQFTDHRNGSYTASYSLNRAGVYFLVLQEKVTGDQLPGSPFELLVSPGVLHAPECRVSATALRCKAGDSARFDVLLFDQYSNPISTARIPDLHRRLRLRFYVPIQVVSPEASSARSATRHAWSGCVLSGEATAESGFVAEGSATVLDAGASSHSQPGEGHQGESRALAPSPPQTAAVTRCRISPSPNSNSVQCEFTPTLVGALHVETVLDDADMGPPVVCEVVAGPLHPSGCALRGDGLREAVAGETASFNVIMRDLYGNPVDAGDDDLKAELHVVGASPIIAHVQEVGRGIYAVSYCVHKSGKHKLYVTLNRVPLAGSPFQIVVHCAETSSCEIDARRLQGVRIGMPVQFSVRAFDRHGNRASKGGDDFRGELGSHRLNIFLGTHTVTPTSGLTFTVLAGAPHAAASGVRTAFLRHATAHEAPRAGGKLGAQHAGDPPASAWTPQPDPEDGESVHAFLHPLPEVSLMRAGDTSEIDLVPVDRFGNFAGAELGDWQIKILRVTGPAETLPKTSHMQPLIGKRPDGSCYAQFRLDVAGDYSCLVMLMGREVANSPFALTLVPSHPSAAHSGPAGALPQGMAGEDGTFLLYCRDAYGNRQISGGAQLVVQLECEGRVQRAAVHDQDDGSYLVRYRAERAVVHMVHAWLVAGDADSKSAEEPEYEPLSNSPWGLSIVPGEMSAAVSDASGPGTISAVAGEVSEVFVQLRDLYGNARSLDRERIVAALQRTPEEVQPELPRFSAELPQLHAAELEAAHADEVRSEAQRKSELPTPMLRPTDDGRMLVSYKPTRAENVLLHVGIQERGQDINIRGSPFLVEVVPAQCAAHREFALIRITIPNFS